MNEKQQDKPTEKSLGYISWSLKEISANIKKMTEIFEHILHFIEQSPQKHNLKAKQDDLPF